MNASMARCHTWHTAVVLAVVCLLLAACSGSISGTFVNTQDQREYLELKGDGTYYVFVHGVGLTGSYERDGSKLTLKTAQGLAIRADIRGNDLCFEKDESWFSGEVWKRK